MTESDLQGGRPSSVGKSGEVGIVPVCQDETVARDDTEQMVKATGYVSQIAKDVAVVELKIVKD